MANTLDPETVRQRLRTWLSGKLPVSDEGDGEVLVDDVEVPATSGMSNDTVLFRASRSGGPEMDLVARIHPTGPGVGGWVTELTPGQRAAMYDNGLRALAAVHALDWRELGLGFVDRPELGDTGIGQMLAHYQRAYTWAARDRRFPTVEAGFDWVGANLPTGEPTVLCHGDARLANLVYPDDLSVAAVLDWELVTLGSPELDLGWWLFVMRHHTEGIGVPLPEGFPSHEQTVRRYQELSGHEVRHIHFYEVFAALFLSFTMIQVANVLTDAGMLPPDATMAESNPASQLLAAMLGLPAPTASSSTFIGQR
jgi:aminoglycoside phosphotransferase (APT) family kinase protein